VGGREYEVEGERGREVEGEREEESREKKCELDSLR
jgi:hypothetical protein